MRRPIKLICSLGVAFMQLALPSRAQFVFTTDDLPGEIGIYWRAYVSTNVNLSSRVGQTGGPQRWDFSEAQQPSEYLLRTEVVSANDARQQQRYFPDSAYAERETNELTHAQAWSYYRLLPGSGRVYYGFNITGTQASGPSVFDTPPPIDFPDCLHLGQNWNWSASYHVSVANTAVNFTNINHAAVDGFGTLVLPNIGEVPAWRVTEIHTNNTYVGATPNTSTVDTYVYWLVRGVGKAVQIIFHGIDRLHPATPLPNTNSLLRIFQASNIRPPQQSVSDLRLAIVGSNAVCNWTARSNALHYHVETCASLESPTPWQCTGIVTNLSWSEPLSHEMPQHFYRVFSE